jgi:oxygen-independent coproporphyrinogen-3 oxidase
LYAHVPFCFHKCHYCDFYSLVDTRDRQAAFTRRMVEEIEAARPYLLAPVRSIFVGGGTPTLLEPELWGDLLDAIGRGVPGVDAAEFTVEANPETVTPGLLAVLIGGGVDRVSVGAQSFEPAHLETLERWHEPASVERAVTLVHAAGIDDVNLDLIFGIPGQTLAEWERDLDRAMDLGPTHLSCYGLMYEPGTPLTTRMRRGEIVPAPEDLQAEMYDAAQDRLAAAGFEHYEISNWAQPDRQCRHNVAYWTNASWWALGPSAAGHAAGWRWRNTPRLTDYLESGPLAPIDSVERLEPDGRVGEELMLRLRMIDGVPTDRLETLLARGRRGAERAEAIARHVDAGLLARTDTHVRLTRRGRLLADTVLCDLV